MKDEHATLLRMRDTQPELSAEEVLGYLAQHPDFFMRHEQALHDLELPHRAGTAVSLVERQVSLLRERNIDSRQRLGRLLETARENDLLFARTRRLILALLEAGSLARMSMALAEALRRDFGVEQGRLIMITDADEVAPQGVDSLPRAVAADTLKGLFRSGKPIVGPLRPQERALLFAGRAEEVQSAAVVPLGSPEPFALLAAGSEDARRFHGEMGTLFLEFIGEVLERLLPRVDSEA